jgi:hypothetical protein
MTFAAANLEGVPWEVLFKAYRDHLGSKCHDHLPAYVTDFFEFVSENTSIFPMEMQERQFVSLADRAAAALIFPIMSSDAYKAEGDDTKRGEVLVSALKKREREIEAQPFVTDIQDKDVKEFQERFLTSVVTELKADQFYNSVMPEAEMELLARLAIAFAFKIDFRGRTEAGLVFAGFGDKDYFPRLEEYRCHGLILGRSLFNRRKEVKISQDNAAELIPLAQAEMINTFIWGVSATSMSKMHGIFVKRLNELEDTLKTKNLIGKDVNLDQLKSDTEDKIRTEVVEHFYETHQRPVRRVIASLPIDELAALAETLVYIESLKERVTSPAESVSGPIDVAVISKHDGFIWIKRKHYFNKELNPRYFVREQREE